MSIKKPTIQNVTNLKNGDIYNSVDFFQMDEETIYKMRHETESKIQEQKPLLVCSLCHQAVKIRGSKGGLKTMHFAHLHSSGDCPIKTGRDYTLEEINAMKYNGAKESEEHRRLKMLIAEYLEKDNNFNNVKIEQTQKSIGLQKDWRRPDISAIFNEKKI